MEESTRTRALEGEGAATDYENVKMNTEGVSIFVALAITVISETICSLKQLMLIKYMIDWKLDFLCSRLVRYDQNVRRKTLYDTPR